MLKGLSLVEFDKRLDRDLPALVIRKTRRPANSYVVLSRRVPIKRAIADTVEIRLAYLAFRTQINRSVMPNTIALMVAKLSLHCLDDFVRIISIQIAN